MLNIRFLWSRLCLFILFILPFSLKSDDTVFSLDECLKIALEKNRRLEISKIQRQIAQNKYEQALASLYPIISAKLGGFYIKRGYEFKSPASVIALDPQFVDLQATAIAQSQLSLQGVTPAAVGQDNYLAALNAAKTQISSNISGLKVDEQVVEVTSPWTATGSLDLVYPLFTGGKRRSYRKIRGFGVENSKVEEHQTLMDVYFDVKKIYLLSVLANELHKTASDLIDEMNVSLELTEKIYKAGETLDVSKADYLQHKMAVEQIKLIKMQIEKNQRDLGYALAFVIGFEGDTKVAPQNKKIEEFPIAKVDLQNKDIESKIISFNPDWKKIEAGIQMQEENIKISKADYYPTIAFIGNFGFLENNKDVGNVLSIDERNYTVGLVMEIPIFNGFSTKKQVAEKKLELEALKHQSILLKDVLRLEVVNYLNQMNSLEAEINLQAASFKLAEELVEAQGMAYQVDKKKWEDLLNSEVYRSYISAQLSIMRFEKIVLQEKLNKVFGNALFK